MELLELVRINLFSPMILAFALGIVAVLLRSDLRIPEQVYTLISIYLLFSIGLEGGYDLSGTSIADFIGPALVTIAIGAFIPLWMTFALTRFGNLSKADAIAIGTHYGGVSSVTLSTAIAFLADLNVPYEGFLPTLYVVMELPAFFVALLLVSSQLGGKRESLRDVVLNTLSGKTFILLGGGVIIGLLSGEAGEALMSPFFFDLFPGFLTLFLLQMGTVVGERLGELRGLSPFVWAFSIIAPTLHALLGISLGTLVGLSAGGAFILGIIASSASFISAPAIVQTNIPQANPGIYMASAMIIAFPYNILLGMPLYYEFAVRIGG